MRAVFCERARGRGDKLTQGDPVGNAHRNVYSPVFPQAVIKNSRKKMQSVVISKRGIKIYKSRYGRVIGREIDEIKIIEKKVRPVVFSYREKGQSKAEKQKENYLYITALTGHDKPGDRKRGFSEKKKQQNRHTKESDGNCEIEREEDADKFNQRQNNNKAAPEQGEKKPIAA